MFKVVATALPVAAFGLRVEFNSLEVPAYVSATPLTAIEAAANGAPISPSVDHAVSAVRVKTKSVPLEPLSPVEAVLLLPLPIT